jgi:coenzyme F420-0:L-glutamate ligase / coenzyme F420-1:gamma-L-glutamate ligase
LSRALTLLAPAGLPEIHAGDDLAALLLGAFAQEAIGLDDGDVVVLAQKIVSKAEGRSAALSDIRPGAEALRLAAICEKEPALIELVLRESTEVLRCTKGVIIVRHRLGFVLANAGIDRSNVPGAEDHALLLPENPDRSAEALRAKLSAASGKALAVLINDSFGRAWRLGTTGTCIGCAGLEPLKDLRGAPDRFGRSLQVTELAHADEIAASASLLMGQAGEGRPVVIVKGLQAVPGSRQAPASALIRPKAEDLFP